MGFELTHSVEESLETGKIPTRGKYDQVQSIELGGRDGERR